MFQYPSCFSIFVRHLECDRDEAFLTEMEKFIKTVVGNSYKISMRQLLFRKKSLKKVGGVTTSEVEQDPSQIEQR